MPNALLKYRYFKATWVTPYSRPVAEKNYALLFFFLLGKLMLGSIVLNFSIAMYSQVIFLLSFYKTCWRLIKSSWVVEAITLFFLWKNHLSRDPPAMQETQETWVQSLGKKDPLEKEMATHSTVLAWEIPWTKESGGLQSNGVTKSWTQLSD